MRNRAPLACGTCLLVVQLVGACAASKSPTKAPTGSEEPANEPLSQEQLEAEFEHEAEPIQKQPLNGGELWQAYLEAKVPPTVERHAEFYSVTADLGWGEDLSCYVYDRTIDAGSASHTMISEAKKAVEFKRLVPYHLGNAGLDPILGIRGIYHVEEAGVVAAGDYKLMVMPRLEYPVLCTHDAPGYAQSFARVTTEFAASFSFESELPKPMRGELWRAALDDIPIGFTQRFTYEVEGGGARSVSISSRFMPTAPGEIGFEDMVDIVRWNREGALLDGKYLSFENGQPNFEVELTKKQQSYAYTGSVQDKPVSGSFRSKQPIVGQFALERRLKQLASKNKKKNTRFEQWEYLPSLDPAQSSKVSYDVRPHSGAWVIEASLGQRAMVMQANGRGVLKQQVFAIGPRQLRVDLINDVGEL